MIYHGSDCKMRYGCMVCNLLIYCLYDAQIYFNLSAFKVSSTFYTCGASMGFPPISFMDILQVYSMVILGESYWTYHCLRFAIGYILGQSSSRSSVRLEKFNCHSRHLLWWIHHQLDPINPFIRHGRPSYLKHLQLIISSVMPDLAF